MECLELMLGTYREGKNDDEKMVDGSDTETNVKESYHASEDTKTDTCFRRRCQ